MKNFGEFFNNQIQFANTIILSRTDLVDNTKIEEAVALIKNVNPEATIVTTPLDKLTNEKIEFLQDGHLIENINLCEKFEIYKTYDDYYHKSQKYKGAQEKLRKWLLPIALISVLQIFKFVKWLFYLVKTKGSYYKSDDAVIIFQEDKVLNILATSRFERALIKKYFLSKFKIDIDELEFYKELGHNYENIKIGE